MLHPEYQFFEYACHEGNYAMRNILSAERAAEKKKATPVTLAGEFAAAESTVNNEVHERLARQAIELARQARAAGNHPFGALLVLDGNVVASAQNTVHTDRDPTAHAETNLVSHAIRELSPEQMRAAASCTRAASRARCASARCIGPESDQWRTRFQRRNSRSWPAEAS